MTRFKINLEYDGTNLIGWQSNKDGVSVQSLVSDAIYKFCGERADVVSAGRTDAGVHAICMTAHFDLDKEQNPDTIMRALNFYLVKEPVSVLSCECVDDDFHARFSCTKRNYRYIVLNRPSPVVLKKNRVWWVPQKLDIEKMKVAAKKLVGKHDFTSFRAAQCQAKSPIKTLDSATITQNDDEIIFDFSARSFLHHQVRNMVGTLVEIGLGKPYDIDEIFAEKKRNAAGVNAPPFGLYFVSATYAMDDGLKNV
ncbi:MAG: tRNA pseudouridine(38-40) synthase TruA [Alphaproteobacteria bacterium]|nr:tRNA pseudouridine(38-40) synthase TruA [Alphaproteobacteria bacterium]